MDDDKLTLQANGYNVQYYDSGSEHYLHRVLIGTPTTGNIRMEWHISRIGQIIPCNWSQANQFPFYSGNHIVTMRYPVADAQNLIVRQAVEGSFEWLFLVEHDVLLPPHALLILNEYMRRRDTPVVSGLYYTRARPSEPIIYRGRGNSFYGDWQHGDIVWCDGVPTGCLLIHTSILKAMYEDAQPYQAWGQTLRKVFDVPAGMWTDPEGEQYATYTGTSDLYWCKSVMDGDYFTKAGWPEYADREFPFALDTNLFCGHINPNGEQFPYPAPWERVKAKMPDVVGPQPEALSVDVTETIHAGDKVG